jgi:hypothetical protein
MDQAQGLDPMAFPELLDALADWTVHHRPSLEQRGFGLTAKDSREYGKWAGTVEIEASQRVGYLSVWSSGELDCQVFRAKDFLVLNEHRFVRSRAELESALTTFVEVVGYADPREPPLSR